MTDLTATLTTILQALLRGDIKTVLETVVETVEGDLETVGEILKDLLHGDIEGVLETVIPLFPILLLKPYLTSYPRSTTCLVSKICWREFLWRRCPSWRRLRKRSKIWNCDYKLEGDGWMCMIPSNCNLMNTF